ncbi:hypothetical protein PP459_gp076 [Streptomyces phage Wakanda]|uniref:Uncharacterized protein n=2 Tax=Wakandavirus TaxID=3044854 RepID=A0A6G8R3D9_9CAUD|nr:hypothetical protein PP459_gp076 [Streptomyces phage Wakanda]YP_010652476.1 hypothetical protein PP460_gp082 [Streptomyces phage Muntaha]QIN94157.1 hypothetical protein SEA_WAKANDA_196 [Streptomyces phage Wakanda]QIN94720.1 hypothetical protein SEA_MUNTAHA_196 [Streptomyces phage Muntaha]
MSFTVDDLAEWAEDYESGFYWSDLDGGYSEYDSPFGRVKWVETDTDYDEGRQLNALVFTVGDRFFRKHGYYDSWEGGAWDGGLEEVRPREKMITVYEAV